MGKRPQINYGRGIGHRVKDISKSEGGYRCHCCDEIGEEYKECVECGEYTCLRCCSDTSNGVMCVNCEEVVV